MFYISTIPVHALSTSVSMVLQATAKVSLFCSRGANYKAKLQKLRKQVKQPKMAEEKIEENETNKKSLKRETTWWESVQRK